MCYLRVYLHRPDKEYHIRFMKHEPWEEVDALPKGLCLAWTLDKSFFNSTSLASGIHNITCAAV